MSTWSSVRKMFVSIPMRQSFFLTFIFPRTQTPMMVCFLGFPVNPNHTGQAFRYSPLASPHMPLEAAVARTAHMVFPHPYRPIYDELWEWLSLIRASPTHSLPNPLSPIHHSLALSRTHARTISHNIKGSFSFQVRPLAVSFAFFTFPCFVIHPKIVTIISPATSLVFHTQDIPQYVQFVETSHGFWQH